MKLVAKGDLLVDDMCAITPVLKKEECFSQPFNSYTSGLIKYLGLPKGSRIRVTIELIEEGDD